jgi:molybdopterin converting factor small subunit
LKVKIDVQYFLMHLTEDQMVVEVEGNTIKECLDQLIARYPKVKKWLYRADGGIANFIDIFINLDSVFPNQLSDPVKDGDVIYIVMMHTAG